MKSHEVLRDVIQKAGPKVVADYLNVSLSLIYKWTQAQGELGSGSRNPLDRIQQLIKCGNDQSIVQWICHQSGGFFIQNVNATESDQKLYPAMNNTLQEFATLLSTMTRAGEDNRITEEEAENIRQCWESVKSITEGFVNNCESGKFDHLRS
ncbi:MAG: phage regulatory CII family protein [Verrucomicrobiota bacterium]